MTSPCLWLAIPAQSRMLAITALQAGVQFSCLGRPYQTVVFLSVDAVKLRGRRGRQHAHRRAISLPPQLCRDCRRMTPLLYAKVIDNQLVSPAIEDAALSRLCTSKSPSPARSSAGGLACPSRRSLDVVGAGRVSQKRVVAGSAFLWSSYYRCIEGSMPLRSMRHVWVLRMECGIDALLPRRGCFEASC